MTISAPFSIALPSSLRAPAQRRTPAIEKMISPVPFSRIGMLMVPSEPSIREAGYRGEQKADDCEHVRMPGEEIASSTEPRQESHRRRSVEPGNVRAASEPAVRGFSPGVMRVMKWQVHVER